MMCFFVFLPSGDLCKGINGNHLVNKIGANGQYCKAVKVLVVECGFSDWDKYIPR